MKFWRSRIIKKLSDAIVDARDFRFKLLREAFEFFLLGGISGRETGLQMIQRKINVVQRIPNFVRDSRCQTADHDRFLGVIKLGFKLTRARQLHRHLIEELG